MNDDYQSPYQIPKCNNLADARDYPSLHRSTGWDTGVCPYHSEDAQYRDWQGWYKAREAFATASTERDSAYHLKEMLRYVSATNPPDVPVKRRVPRPQAQVKRAPSPFLAVACLAVGFLLIVLGFACDALRVFHLASGFFIASTVMNIGAYALAHPRRVK